MSILVVGIQGISQSYYEASEIDGAGKTAQFFKITLPLLKPTLGFCLITNTIGSLQVFDTDTFTVDGKKLDSYKADVDTDDKYTPDTEVIEDGAFKESKFRSAPYFDVKIDGIKLLNEKM